MIKFMNLDINIFLNFNINIVLYNKIIYKVNDIYSNNKFLKSAYIN